MVREEEKTREQKLLEDAQMIILKDKETNLKKIQEQHEILKKQQILNNLKIKTKIAHDTINAIKEIPADECWQPSLQTDQEQTVKQVCGEIASQQNVDVHMLSHCLTKSSFCESCCDFKIGFTLVTQRKQCYQKCEQVMILLDDQKQNDPPAEATE